MAAASLLSGTAIAQNGPIIEPGPVQILSDDAHLVSRILLDPQLKNCVAELQNSIYEFSVNRITFQALTPGETQYNFSVNLIKGGDIMVGIAVLTVTKTDGKGFFGNPIPVYNCKISYPNINYIN